ncbi:MAG: electron transport complex protein RnfA [Clostridia bacterium]|nr:electron transport complex protein RnfA [Clostridia bacterium]
MLNTIITTAAAVTSSDIVASVADAPAAASVAQGIPFALRLLGIVLAGILTGNFVLSEFLGCCPFLGVSKKLDTAFGMSAAVIFVMLLATAVTYPIYALLAALGIEYLQTIVFILVIAALVQLVEIVLKKFIPSLYESLGVYLPLITTNCAVLGVTILVIEDYFGIGSGYSFGSGYLASLFCSLGSGIGFLVAMVLFAGVRGRMEDSDIPESLKGLPITLVAASIVALSFMGFSGIIAGLGLE